MPDTSPAPYQSARGLARFTVLLLGLGILVSLVATLARYGQLLLIGDIQAGAPFPEAYWTTSFARARAITYTETLLFFATGVAFLAWSHRAYRNLDSLGAQGLLYSPGWAAGAWFVPVLNLFRPYQIIRELHAASDPEQAPPSSFTWLSGIWWALWLVHTLFTVVVQQILGQAEDLHTYVRTSRWEIAVELLTALGAVAAITVVLTITARQEARRKRQGAEPAQPADPADPADPSDPAPGDDVAATETL
ncbi:MAG TPA: DUF4328 domain-containing protein [Symbiobacteriaceae bacterium]|nr:DUF4328 domain-containing protein [Symbiobacteriaceae bacterium]